jgi:predicted ester cyclase
MLHAAFPDLQHTIIEQIAEYEKVVNLVSASGTHKGAFQSIAATEKSVVITDIFITSRRKARTICAGLPDLPGRRNRHP